MLPTGTGPPNTTNDMVVTGMNTVDTTNGGAATTTTATTGKGTGGTSGNAGTTNA